ncbi:MAG: TonB-dependent receptor [Prevotella sp.]|nr:TonB-dependent receptor [Prevotella sp.]
MKTPTLLLACALSLGIHAQGDNMLHDFERDTIALSQVVVTGTRTPKTLADVPVATRVITTKDIERTDATDIQDLLTQEMPGVEFSYAMNQQTHLNFSGFGGQSILFLVDGERLAGETMDDVDFSRLLMAGVERIEIVKGAASALYGSNAEGGVVNIITKESTKTWNLHLDTRWGRHHSQRHSGIFSLNRRHWSNALSASFSDIDNYKVSSKAKPATRVFSEVYGDRVVNVKDKIIVRPADGLKLSARAGYYFRQVPRVPNEPERYRDFSAGAKGEWNITDNDFAELSYTFDQYDKSTLQRSQNLDIRTYSNVQNSVRALYSHSMGSGDILTLGGNMMRDYLINDKLTEGKRQQTTADAFAQYDWNISQQWEAVGALRYDYFSDGSLSRLTPKLSLRYQPRRNVTLRTSYGMGFRAPTLKEKYYEFDMSGIWIVEGNANLRSEMSHNLNASVEYTKGRFNIMAMGYYNSVKNKISTGTPYYSSLTSNLSPLTSQLYLSYTNLDTYSVYGTDLTARYRWDIVSAKVGYAFTKERLPKSNGNTINNQYIPARPHALNWELCVDKTFSSDYALSATLSGRFLSSVDNEEYRNYYDLSQGTTTVHYPAYSLWKLMVVGHLWSRIKLSVAIDNLLNYKPDYYYLNSPITDGTNVMIGLGVELF